MRTQARDNAPCPRTGNQVVLGTTAPSEAYRCKGDGPNDYVYIYSTRAGNAQWERLLKVIGREDLLDDPRFATPQARADHVGEVDAIVQAWCRDKGKYEVMETLGQRRRAGRRRDGHDGAVRGPEHARARDLRHRRSPGARRVHHARLAGQDVAIARAACRRRRCSARDNEAVYGAWLGYTREQLADSRKRARSERDVGRAASPRRWRAAPVETRHMNGSQILAEALERQGVDMFFFIMGAPMLMVEAEALKRGLRGIDVRHEQAAAMMAHAYARLRLRPACAWPPRARRVTNLVTGVAHAWADGAPLIALGGSAPVGTWGRGAFQEIDQLAMMKPITKWAARVHHAKRIPESWTRRSAARCRASPARSTSICRATCCTRRSTRRRSTGRSPGIPRRAAGRRRRRPRSRRCSAMLAGGRAPDRHRRQRRAVVGRRGRAAGVRRADRHPVLHHAAEPRHDPRGSRALLSDRALERVPRGRPDPGDRHAPQLRHRPRRAAALRRRGQARAHRHRPRRDRDQPASSTSASSATPGRCSASCCSAAAERVERRPLRDLARAAARAQQRQAGRAGGAAWLVRGADPPAAAVQGGPRLHRPRRHPGGRRPGDPQLRPPDDPDLRARPPAELGRVRHHGRRPAVRRRRQARQARQAGAGAARRRLVRHERHGVRHRGAPQACRCWW